MKLELRDILKKHDNAYIASQQNRERAANDLLFARWTHWDDDYLCDQLEFRGEFDLLKKARRKNISELRANPVQVSFIPSIDGEEKTAAVLEKKYRYDMSSQSARSCLVMAQQDQVDCGFGAWRLTTETTNDKYNNQYIKRTPILEANNVVFYDPDCNEMDRSDASFVSIILSITDDGWHDFAESIGIDPDSKPSSFRPPEDSYNFPWVYGNKTYYVSEFYHRYPIKVKTYLLENGMGEEILVDELEYEAKAEYFEFQGFEIVDEGEYSSHKVKKYFVSGSDILKEQDIAGTEIPVVPIWGDTYKVEGQWCWEGIVRAAKDPQRLRDFMLSYIADIAAKGARQRPIFSFAQISGLEYQFDAGPDNNRPFYVLNDTDEDGNPLPMQPMGEIRPPEIPQAAAGLLGEVNQAVNDVADPGVLGESATSNIAHKTVATIQKNVDMQAFGFVDNTALALQREAEIFASMSRDIFDTTRDIEQMDIDGKESTVEIMKPVLDENGDLSYENDLGNGTYRVRTKVTQGYASERDQKRIEMQEVYAQTDDPEAKQVMLLEVLSNMDSQQGYVDKWARRKAIDLQLVDPDDLTEEEIQELQAKAQQQQGQPDPMQLAAEAAMVEAQAALGDSQAKQMDSQTKVMQQQVNKYKADTERMKVMVEAQETGAKITNINADTQLKRTSSGKNIRDMVRGTG